MVCVLLVISFETAIFLKLSRKTMEDAENRTGINKEKRQGTRFVHHGKTPFAQVRKHFTRGITQLDRALPSQLKREQSNNGTIAIG